MARYTGILNAASIAGVCSYALFLLYNYVLDINPFGPVKFLGVVIPAVFMYLAVRRFREQETEGFITFRQAFAIGSIFVMVYSSLCGMLTFLHGSLLDPGLTERIMQFNLEGLGMMKDAMLEYRGREEYERLLEEAKNTGMGDIAMGDFISKAFGSTLLALVIAIILRKKPPIFDRS